MLCAREVRGAPVISRSNVAADERFRPSNVVGEAVNLFIEKLQGGQQKVNVQLLMPKSQKHPVTAPPAVSTERVSDEIGLLRITMFPGAIGIDVANDIDRGIAVLPPTPAQNGRERRA
jgi:hypothetical protein